MVHLIIYGVFMALFLAWIFLMPKSERLTPKLLFWFVFGMFIVKLWSYYA